MLALDILIGSTKQTTQQLNRQSSSTRHALYRFLFSDTSFHKYQHHKSLISHQVNFSVGRKIHPHNNTHPQISNPSQIPQSSNGNKISQYSDKKSTKQAKIKLERSQKKTQR